MLVTFKSLGRSQRVWQVRFDLGSEQENAWKALDYAWKLNAEIVDKI